MRFVHEYRVTQQLPISREKAWQFFSSPKNLSLITPPEMDFRILTKDLPEDIHDGMIIDYKVRPLLRISMRWKTRLQNILPHQKFTDIQLKGPYSIWEHTHIFEENEKGILMTDIIRYKIPMGFLGNWMNRLFIRKKIKSIFDYRKITLEKMFQS